MLCISKILFAHLQNSPVVNSNITSVSATAIKAAFFSGIRWSSAVAFLVISSCDSNSFSVWFSDCGSASKRSCLFGRLTNLLDKCLVFLTRKVYIMWAVLACALSCWICQFFTAHSLQKSNLEPRENKKKCSAFNVLMFKRSTRHSVVYFIILLEFSTCQLFVDYLMSNICTRHPVRIFFTAQY